MKGGRGALLQKLIQVRAPEAMAAAIEVAASQQFTSKSDYVRRSVLDRLRSDGFDLRQSAAAV